MFFVRLFHGKPLFERLQFDYKFFREFCLFMQNVEEKRRCLWGFYNLLTQISAKCVTICNIFIVFCFGFLTNFAALIIFHENHLQNS